MGKRTKKRILHTNDLDAVFAGRRGRVLKVSAAELDGIRDILAKPQPPTPELEAAWEEYMRYTANNPDSNW